MAAIPGLPLLSPSPRITPLPESSRSLFPPKIISLRWAAIMRIRALLFALPLFPMTAAKLGNPLLNNLPAFVRPSLRLTRKPFSQSVPTVPICPRTREYAGRHSRRRRSMLSLRSTHNTSSPPVPKASSPNLSARNPNDRIPLTVSCSYRSALGVGSCFSFYCSVLRWHPFSASCTIISVPTPRRSHDSSRWHLCHFRNLARQHHQQTAGKRSPQNR